MGRDGVRVFWSSQKKTMVGDVLEYRGFYGWDKEGGRPHKKEGVDRFGS